MNHLIASLLPAELPTRCGRVAALTLTALLFTLGAMACSTGEQATAVDTGNTTTSPPEPTEVPVWRPQRASPELNASAWAIQRMRDATPSHRWAMERDGGVTFAEWQAEARAQLQALIGPLAEGPDVPLEVRVAERFERRGVRYTRVRYRVEEDLSMEAWALGPVTESARRPVVVLLPGHTRDGSGASVLAGLATSEDASFQQDAGAHLARSGYRLLIPNTRTYGATGEPGTHHDFVGRLQLMGRSAVALYVADALRASRVSEAVFGSAEPLVFAGVSLGGAIALYSAALGYGDAAIVQGFFGSYAHAMTEKPHCPCSVPPGLPSRLEMADVAALVAPRPMQVAIARNDPWFPYEPVPEAAARLHDAYHAAGAPRHLSYEEHDLGHTWDGEHALAFLNELDRSWRSAATP